VAEAFAGKLCLAIGGLAIPRLVCLRMCYAFERPGSRLHWTSRRDAGELLYFSGFWDDFHEMGRIDTSGLPHAALDVHVVAAQKEELAMHFGFAYLAIAEA
jgi:hypothetical protein